ASRAEIPTPRPAATARSLPACPVLAPGCSTRHRPGGRASLQVKPAAAHAETPPRPLCATIASLEQRQTNGHSMDRKRALTRLYKETAPQRGVYVIRNTASGRTFIGGSMNLPGAINRARFELGLGQHRNAELQRDWLALGADSFAFEVVDTLKQREDP